MFIRSKCVTDIRQVYRDCNAASHYLEDSLTTTKCKGPIRGKILVSKTSLVLDSLIIRRRLIIIWVHCSCIACQSQHKCAILLQCNPNGESLSTRYRESYQLIKLYPRRNNNKNNKLISQFAQLLAIDWIMETRTALWELENGNHENDYYNFVPVESSILTKFQNDLNLLRCLTINMPVSVIGGQLEL